MRSIVCLTLVVLLVATTLNTGCNRKDDRSLTVAISPYQDIAMIVNIHNLDLEKKYGLKVILNTMAWEDIVPAIASAGQTVDLGFGSLAEYLTKEKNLNPTSDDPVLFIYPAYIFKGGSFITFNSNIPTLTKDMLNNPEAIRPILALRIGAQKSSIYEMMIYSLARRAGVDPGLIKLYDTPLNDGILATQNGSLDLSAAGLTQITEAQKRGGKVVLTMEDLGFADITGFICKKSVLEKKRDDIEKVIRMWFESVDYVLTDIDKNSAYSLQYLDKNASTKYTLQQYKDAISQEYFPRSIAEANSSIVSDNGQFSYRRISQDMSQYLLQVKKIDQAPTIPTFLSIAENP